MNVVGLTASSSSMGIAALTVKGIHASFFRVS
jgi:hypothetical protein